MRSFLPPSIHMLIQGRIAIPSDSPNPIPGDLAKTPDFLNFCAQSLCKYTSFPLLSINLSTTLYCCSVRGLLDHHNCGISFQAILMSLVMAVPSTPCVKSSIRIASNPMIGSSRRETPHINWITSKIPFQYLKSLGQHHILCISG